MFAHEDDAVYGRLLRSVAGVVFLGTPHKGSNAANLGSVIGRIINVFLATASSGLQTRTIRTDLLDYLKNDSQALQALSISVRNRLADLMIISFYESEVLPPFSSVSIGCRDQCPGRPASKCLLCDRSLTETLPS